jgi:hypothetical protein
MPHKFSAFVLLIAAFLFAVTIAAAPAARAQLSLYVTSANNRVSNVETGSALTSSGYQQQYTSFWTSGVGGGVSATFLPLGPVKVGFDLRGSTHPGTVGSDTAFGGIKVGINPPAIHIKPYIQASGGYIDTRTVNVSTSSINPTQTVGGTFDNKYAAWEILGGIDLPLVHFIDLRLIEVGGGQAFGILNNGPNPSLFTLNTGLALHF